ncbi:MAG: tannase/feruloyl esterase family alpha/beta hydrolase [Kordiimonadaceae bacterium]|nr:tannase/feruloyl esterase family alpha/beta hydrolase [Kordiimonadaceae bacterium]
MDFSKISNGDAATKVMSGTLIKGVELTPAEARQISRRGMVMGAPFSATSKRLPDHCLVMGYVSPHIKFELRLPTPENWNNKFLLTACDGFCGKAPSDAPMAGVARNYAAMSTDGGHWGEHPFDGVWAKDNMQARIDFAYRANHVLLMAAKAITKAYYGVQQKYSYMTGCSKGGHAGVMSAQRYPNDFDGIIARDPTINYTKVNVLRCGDTTLAVYDKEWNVLLDASKTPLIQQAVMDYCDDKDGLKDGLISDPRKCDFDPKTIQCGQPGVGPDCLTATETQALIDLYSPILDENGKEIYAGQPLGSEMAWPAWALPTSADDKIYAYKAYTEYLKYFAFRKAPGIDFDPRDFDYNRDKGQLADMSHVFDADNPDMRDFRDSGNKLMVLHGWADPAVPPNATIEWYEMVSNTMGGRDQIHDYMRLFLMPGLNHCDGGVGPETFEALSLLEDWVENGNAPDMMMTNKLFQGEVERTRPVYPYPLEAKYKGRGSIDDAKNFEPFDPTK